ncbi:hypothetical protein [Pseudogracilibacillus auburnensis]|uniref:hypothetical protein n=1 Tax=Pseudogracilibacillus auburnensis TaxID=1494959 RepID=UPI001A978F3F|nr:hypothetical protein [Pseudogracilibacillus auburnensis]MBO1001298.1 hypothetical protein [Pseudogracilibacillus auburnensis]
MNVQISRHVPAYDRFAKSRKNINSINSSHVELVALLERTDDINEEIGKELM